nr:TonB-dependent receptor [Sphingomonas bacterium]
MPASVPARPTRTRPTTPPPADANSDEPDVIVTGQRNLPGAVIGDISPEQQLGPADIRSYGVSSVSDLINELGPQIRSDRGSGGAPVVLLNGRRISGFQEVRDLPTEAIARVDILPEEVALKYGYPADQKVVNIVLRRRFRATTVELADRQSTEGGRNAPDGNVDLLSIKNAGRINVHLDYTQSAALTEAQRDITQQPSLFAQAGNVAALPGGIIDPRFGTATVAGVPAAAANGAVGIGQFTPGVANPADQGAFRTLLPSTKALTANMVYATNIFANKVGATFNAELETSDSTSLQGLPTATFTLPAGNPFSPFANTVLVDRALAGTGALTQNISSVTGHLGSTFNGNVGDWRWSLTASLDHVHSETFTDTGLDSSAFQTRLTAGDAAANPFGTVTGLNALPGSYARSTSTTGTVDALFNGTIFDLPAGSVSTSVRVGGSISDFSSNSYRAGLTSATDLSRDIGSGQLNVDVPLTSRSKAVLGAIGTLSVNGNIAVRHLSDFGTLTTRGFGFNWAPRDGIRVLGSITDQNDAPTQQQLGNPLVVTPNVRVFDYVLGTTANVTTVSGGNPGLVADSAHTMKLELNLKPWKTKDITFVANYISSHTDNAIVAFPTPTAAIEGAFPGRFTRDSGGNLTRLDTRPINFARTERSEIRYGINFSHALKSRLQKQIEAFRAGTGPNPFAGLPVPDFFRRQGGGQGGGQGGDRGGPPGGDGAPPPTTGAGASPTTGTGSTTGGTTAPGEGGGRGFGGGGFGGGGFGGAGGGGRGGGGGGFGGGPGGRQGGGRLQFALYHTWHFTDRVLVSPTGPALDLLNGDAIGQSGGQSRHELEGQAGYINNGLGVRLSANYASGTSINGGSTGNATTLNFSSLTTLNLRLFADATGRIDLIAKHPWLRGVRATLAFENVFDSRQRVTDQTGTTPISYQPDYLNPLGRTVRLSIRKLFF